MSVQGAINNVINTAAGASVIKAAIGDEAMERKRLKKYGDRFDKAVSDELVSLKDNPRKLAQFQNKMDEISELKKDYMSDVKTESGAMKKAIKDAPRKDKKSLDVYGHELADKRLERIKKQLHEKGIIRRSPMETKQFADISTTNAIDEKRLSNDSKKNIDLYIGGRRVDFTSENNPKGEIPDFILQQLKGGVK